MRNLLIALCVGLTATLAAAEIGEIDVRSGPAATAAAESTNADRTALWIQTKTRITVVIVDAHGHRTGVDSSSYQTVQQIPNSDCEVNFVANRYPGEAHADAYERCTFQPAVSGTYTLNVTGLQDGPFQIDISPLSNNGSSEPSKQIEGLISAGERKTFHLRYDASPQAEMTVIEQKPHR